MHCLLDPEKLEVLIYGRKEAKSKIWIFMNSKHDVHKLFKQTTSLPQNMSDLFSELCFFLKAMLFLFEGDTPALHICRVGLEHFLAPRITSRIMEILQRFALSW